MSLFLLDFINEFKFYPSLLETIGIHVPTRNVRYFPLFTVYSSRKTCLSVRCASKANNVCKDLLLIQ
jgi:hypothetical protein